MKLKATLDIWKGCLDRIERDNQFREIKVEFNREELLEFAEEHYQKNYKKRSTWNGRQIRNAFQTAIALGQHKRTRNIKQMSLTPEEALASNKKTWRVIRLRRRNLEKIAATAHDFDRYMKSVHKYPDAEIAKADQLRDDDFSESSEEEEPIVQRLPTGGRKGSGQHKSKKGSGKSIDISSISRSERRAVEKEDETSSNTEMPSQESSSEESDNDDDDND